MASAAAEWRSGAIYFEDRSKRSEAIIRKQLFHLCPQVSLSYAGKRLKKKKTSTKTSTLTPTFNEALVFQLGKEFLPNVCLEVRINNP